MFVVPAFTNKRRAKETGELHRSLKSGDVIKTIGGVVGTIVEIRKVSPVDTEMVIETGVGDKKSTMVFDIQALYQVMSRSSTIVPADSDGKTVVADDGVVDDKVVENNVAESEPVTEQPPVAVQESSIADDAEPAAEQAAANEPENNVAAEENKHPVSSVKKQSSGAKKSFGAKKSGK